MTIAQHVVLWIFFGAAIVYPIVMRLLARLSLPCHERMFDAGLYLIESEDVSDQDKDTIEALAKDARDWKFMIAAAGVAPVWVIGALLGIVTDLPVNNANPEIKKQFDIFMRNHIILVSCANPFFAIVLWLEFAILTVALSPLLLGRAFMKACDLLLNATFHVEVSLIHARLNSAWRRGVAHS